MVTSFIRNKKKGLLTLAYFIITIGLYLNSGFRYKLFFLTFPLFLFYFLITKLRPKIYFFYLTFGLLFFSFINSLLEIIRTYGNGFNFVTLENLNIQDIFLNFLNFALKLS